MKKYLIIFVFFPLTLASNNLTCTQAFDSANTAYKNGDYIKAAELYQEILNQGKESAFIYYNLGNAYFRLKDIPNAIINYERARLLKPGDEDINFNLRLANNFIFDKITPLTEFILFTWLNTVVNFFHSDYWSISGLASFTMFLVFILLFLFSRSLFKRRFFLFTGFLFLLSSILTTTFAIYSYNNIANNSYAIIVASVSTAKSSPDDSGTGLFIIHEGTRVTVNEELDEWAEIKLPDGNVGWIKTKDYIKIYGNKSL